MTNFGLRVTYDLVYHITVTVPGNYRGKTCGLCGNFNNEAADEFQLPDGNVTKNLQTFGVAWKVPVPGVVCEDGCSGDLCPKCDTSEKAALEAKCEVITNPNGPFAACHAVIAPNSYFRDCVYDICMAEGDQDMLCHSIAAYMLDCQDFGAKVQNWRSPSFCRESSYFYNLLYTVLSTITPKKTLKCPVICVQLLRVVPAAIMRHVCCLVPLHVLVCLTPSRAPRAVWRAVPVITATTTMELAACPLTSVAAITTAKLTR